MAESATSETTLEQILWRAMSRFPERPALVDAEELEQRLGQVSHDAEVPAESWVERFFAGDRLHAPDDLAGAVVQATRGQLHVYEFDLGQLEYVIVEDEEDVVVVSEFGQFTLPNDGTVPRALAAAALPADAPPGAAAEPRAYFVRSSGEVLALDAAQVARALDRSKLKQVSLPAVERPRARLSRLLPLRETSLPLTSEERALRPDGPASLDGPTFRTQIGSASRWSEMLSSRGAFVLESLAPFEALPQSDAASLLAQAPFQQAASFGAQGPFGQGEPAGAAQQPLLVEGGRVAVVVWPRAVETTGAAGAGALAAAQALTAVREGSRPVRLLRSSALHRALAGRAWATFAPERFWVQPERAFRPERIDELLPLPPPTGLVAGDRLPDRVWVERRAFDEGPEERRAFDDGPEEQWVFDEGPEERRFAVATLAEPVAGPVQLPFGLPAIARRTGALPRTALASLHFALERTGAVAAFRLPQARIASPGAAPPPPGSAPLELALPLPQPAGLPRPLPAGLEGLPVRPWIAGQVARLMQSLPFPDAGGLHVGPDLGHALQVFLAAPVEPALSALPRRELSLGAGALPLPDLAAPGAATPALAGEWVPTLPERWTPTLPEAARPTPGEAEVALRSVPPLVRAQFPQPGTSAAPPLDLAAALSSLSGAVALSALPSLLVRALQRGGDWAAGPGAPLPAAVRALPLAQAFHAFGAEPELAGHAPRPLNPGEEEIVIAPPLWAQMGRGAATDVARVLPLPVSSTPSLFDDIDRTRSIDLPLPPPAPASAESLALTSRSSGGQPIPALDDLPLPGPPAPRTLEQLASGVESQLAMAVAGMRVALSPGSVLRFRYPGAPLWWSSATAAPETAERSIRSIVERFTTGSSPLAGAAVTWPGATSSAALLRSIFLATPDAQQRSIDSALAASPQATGGWMPQLDAPAAPPLPFVTVAPPSPGAAAGPVYLAMSAQGLAGLSGSPAARAKAEAVEMDIVAAVPPPPPPIESMGGASQGIEAGGGVSAARARSAPESGSESASADPATDFVSTSKLEGSVDAIAQRIYHRIRRRIENDRERFGG
jgi:hypothetical protein